MTLALSTHESIRAIGRETWNELAGSSAPPHLSFEWLDALERTGCVGAERGWLPLHLTLSEGERVLAAAPAYLKGNSEGEFVFDHQWARFAQASLGIDYYPKLLIAVPFTPASGPRFLIRDGQDRARLLSAFVEGLNKLCEALPASSAHVLFPSQAEAEECEEAGLARRFGMQFHWHNQGYQTFDDFLARFNSKHRHQIKRERREMAARGIELCAISGRDLDPALADQAYDFYRVTVDKFPWGRRYLKRAFFEEVFASMPERLHFVVARQRGGRALGGAINLLGADALYGRYWGATSEVPFLHFNVCFYFGVEECIRRGLTRFEPGAGGEHKVARGFMPTITHSAHHLHDPRLNRAIRDFLARERAAVAEHVEAARSESHLK
jgi:uncharacterized protein